MPSWSCFEPLKDVGKKLHQSAAGLAQENFCFGGQKKTKFRKVAEKTQIKHLYEVRPLIFRFFAMVSTWA